MINALYLGLKFSFSYFSILPITFKNNVDLSQSNILAFMLFFLPLVGLVLGTLSLLSFYFLHSLQWYGALISALLYMILYGFIHTEAVVDVFDALYASHSGKDAYAIIKEPTVGAMGLLYTVALVLIKISGIVFLLLHGYFMEFLAILIVSRLSLLMLFKIHNFKSSFVMQLKKSLSNKYLFTSFSFFTIIGVLLTNKFIILLVVGLIFAYLIAKTIKSKLGFMNGDVLGTTLEGVESLLFLLVALIF